MGVPGVPPGLAGQPHHGVAVDADQAFGLADAVALDQVLEDRDGLLRGQAGVEQRGALALGEAGVARPAVEQADVPLLAVAVTDREIAGVALSRGAGNLGSDSRSERDRRPSDWIIPVVYETSDHGDATLSLFQG